MKKKVLVIIVLVLFLIIIYTVSSYIRISNTMREFKDYLSETSVTNENNLPKLSGCKEDNLNYIQTRIKYIPFLNFKTGKIYLKYSKECYEFSNHSGRHYGAWDIPVELDVKKVDGKWIIVDSSWSLN